MNDLTHCRTCHDHHNFCGTWDMDVIDKRRIGGSILA